MTVIVISDGLSLPTGLSKQMTAICEGLKEDYNIVPIGLSQKVGGNTNFHELKFNPEFDYRTNLLKLFNRFNPDIVLTIKDLWHPVITDIAIMKQFKTFDWIAYLPVDSDPLPKEVILEKENGEIKRKCNFDFLLSKVDYVVAYNEFGRKTIGSACHKVSSVIPNIINTEFFFPFNREHNSEHYTQLLHKYTNCYSRNFIFSFVAVNQERKRFDLLIRTWKRFQRKYKNAFLVMHSLFDAPNNAFDIRRLLKNNDCKNFHYSKKHLSDAQIREIYWISDCFINCSSMEGFGMPIAEAMSCGIPVIRPNFCGPSCFETGIKLDFAEMTVSVATSMNRYMISEKNLYKGMEKIFKNAVLRNQLRIEGIKESKKYSIAKIIPLWKILLEKIKNEKENFVLC